MTPVISERAFEDAIEATLLCHGPDEIPVGLTGVAEEPAPYGDPWTQPGGYHRRRAEDYDRDCVRRLVTDARVMGAGHRYLIQHSAGSGKSFTIAWLAHQLSTLHGPDDRRVFDTIVVITDRRVLDRQLQATVRQFEQTLGVVENIDTTSRQLKDALESGKTIIVTTLQKFPVIAREIGELPGKRFGLIVDEAHSSQSGESTKSLKAVLSPGFA